MDLRGGRVPESGLLRAMRDVQRHRGPDGEGAHVEPGVGLAHRRLAIIDLAGGSQPLFNEDGSVAVVFNGEIYNYRALMAELEALGHHFQTRSDTEVIVHGWEAWGTGLVERLAGMFAFALWDRHARRLFVARDRLGIKPLYYAVTADGWLLFASELKGLLVHPGLRRDLDPRAVADFLAFGYVPDPKTIFAQARKLPPGHQFLVGPGEAEPRIERYWDLDFHPRPQSGNFEQGASELIARLERSVSDHMVSDVPVGAFLSGGVDSGAVTALMARSGQSTGSDNAGGEPVIACTVGFPEREWDETDQARLLAERFGADHRVERADSDGLELMDRLAGLFDEPFADPSALPTWLVCRLARRHVKVVLSGDGGDETFAGYDRYRLMMAEERVRALLPAGLRKPLFGTLGRLYPKADWAPRPLRAKSTFEALARDLSGGYFHGLALMPEALRVDLAAPVLRRDLQGYTPLETVLEHHHAAREFDPLSRLQYLDFKLFLAGRVLTKVDRASMAHGLEVRVPLLDHRFVEWAAGLPPDWRFKGGRGKRIFRQGLAELLPAAWLNRPKRGFNIPLAQWLRGPLAEKSRRLLLDGALGETGLFEMKRIRWMVERHHSGMSDFGAPLWALLMFEAFARRLDAV